MQRQRIHRGRQFQPQEEPALRTRHARTGREFLGDRLGHALLLCLQRFAQAAQVAVIAALLQVFGDGALGGAGRR